MGSVFSPYYAWARGRGTADPTHHCAINVALYGERGARWAMTERGRARLSRTADTFQVGPSALHWDADGLTIDLDEVAVPLPRRVRGRVRVTPAAVTQQAYGIDQAGRHLWWPIAPAARVELSCRHPDLSWSGHGYLDHNRGDEPLEAGFVEWDWSRAPLSEGAAVLYDVTCKDGTQGSLALRFDRTGTAHAVAPPAPAPLPRTLWRVNRHTRADAGTTPRVRTTLEDAPFYARSLVDTRLLGEDVTAVHESLSLTRFSRSWVRLLLPFRMPRRPG